MKILVWGTGSDGIRLSRLYQYYANIYDDDVVGVIDSNPKKWGEILFGQKVMEPGNIGQTEWDKIVIASTLYEAEIREKLISDYRVKESDLLSFSSYCNQKVIHYQYERNLKRNEAHGKCDTYKPFNKNSLVVYTAIIGDYDDLIAPLVTDHGVSYVCFTDQKHIKSDVWDVRYIDEVPRSDRAIRVREYKMLPHKFFPEYETSIWVDASLRILGSLSELIEKYQKYANFLLMPHNERICAYDEAFANIVGLLTPKALNMPQIRKYLLEQYPVDNGLMVGGFLARNHHDKILIQTMEEWYREICSFSQRDQISLPYAIWKTALRYDLCDLCIFNNPWMKRLGHKHLIDARGADK